MWIWLAVGSALMLGLYDVAKKQSLKKNGTVPVLLLSTAFSTLFMMPWMSHGSLSEHLSLCLKAVLVASSWIWGMEALKRLPLTVAGPIKATRPVFVLILSVLIFGERLNVWQWTGSLMAVTGLYLLSLSSKKEGIDFIHNKGVDYMALSVAAGVTSALYDKYIMQSMEPLFVQSWSNFYITLLYLLIIVVNLLKGENQLKSFKWDWNIMLIAVFISIADALYFFALSKDGALLSIISMIRRSSVIVTFALGALLYNEKNLKSKAFDLLVTLIAMGIIVYGSH